MGLLIVDIDIRMLLFLPFNPLEWQTNNFSLQFHFWIKYNDHENKESDHQLKKFLVVEHIIQNMNNNINLKRYPLLPPIC